MLQVAKVEYREAIHLVATCRDAYIIHTWLEYYLTYHRPALLMLLSLAPQRAAQRAADRLMLWVVNSLSNKALDI